MRTPRVRSARLHEHAAAKPTWLGPATRPQASGLGSLFGLSLPVCSRRLRSNRVGRARARSCLVLSWLPARNSAPRSLARTDQQIARGSERATGRGREVGMGSEGRVWNGAGVAAGSGYGGSVEAKATTAAPADVPTSAASVDISLPLPEMSPHIIGLCKELVKGWSSIDSSRFSIETVSGGITNLLLKVSVKGNNGNDSSVTVRLYGPNTDLVIDRKRELQAIPYLSAAGFGARLLGMFENGVVQSFIYARTLSPADMKEPKIAAEIAKELRKFHQVDIPGSKEPQLWNDIFKFLKKAAALKFEDNMKQKRYEKISFREIQDEVQELKDLLDILRAPVVYAHNDLLSGNLMLNDLEGKLYFIDFEYGSYSYRGYDIANHFNEYAGFDCDYNLYPDKDAQYHFFRNYLHTDRPSEVDAQDMEVLYVETNTFRLASHIYWALWALIQAKVSPIDFDYLGYFFLRYGEYKKQRESCFSLAQSFLSELKNG